MPILKIILFALFMPLAFAQKSLRVAAWGGEIPSSLINQFEKKTGIKVYLTTIESNESLLIKLRTSKQSLYDVIAPSNYYITLLEQMQLIQKLDAKRIPELQHIEPRFLNPKETLYTVPFLYGATGIFYNQQWIKTPPRHWQDFWSTNYRDQLLLLDDPREIFSIALLAQNHSPNSENPLEIQKAFRKLLKLTPNIKLFASDAMPRMITDEDALIGCTWNGDAVRAQLENPQIQFVYPQEGYILWSEGFSITQNAKNIDAAYAFINFILEPQNSAEITKQLHFSVTNQMAKLYLSSQTKENAILFPSKETLDRGILQKPISPNILNIYHQYWEKFKLSI
ncbi:MAG: spermidine/putrescine transport system substrate-binding protein [Pseudomonadota bacterium]|nr:spermidine/putrescine transport system substrate-binding protein [Pseudomonadota bacterium]